MDIECDVLFVSGFFFTSNQNLFLSGKSIFLFHFLSFFPILLLPGYVYPDPVQWSRFVAF